MTKTLIMFYAQIISYRLYHVLLGFVRIRDIHNTIEVENLSASIGVAISVVFVQSGTVLFLFISRWRTSQLQPMVYIN